MLYRGSMTTKAREEDTLMRAVVNGRERERCNGPRREAGLHLADGLQRRGGSALRLAGSRAAAARVGNATHLRLS